MRVEAVKVVLQVPYPVIPGVVGIRLCDENAYLVQCVFVDAACILGLVKVGLHFGKLSLELLVLGLQFGNLLGYVGATWLHLGIADVDYLLIGLYCFEERCFLFLLLPGGFVPFVDLELQAAFY